MKNSIQNLYISIKKFLASIFKKKNLMLEEPKEKNIKNSSEVSNIEN